MRGTERSFTDREADDDGVCEGMIDDEGKCEVYSIRGGGGGSGHEQNLRSGRGGASPGNG
jgi:hypothetical protein